MRTSRRRSPSVVMRGSIHMAALVLNTLIGNAVLPLNSSTTCKAHQEVLCVVTHIGASVDKETPHESASTRGACWCAYRRPWWVEAARTRPPLTRPHTFRFRAPHRVLATRRRTWMTCMVAAQPCGGNEAINQSSNQSRKNSISAMLLSVCRFFQRREVAVVEWWLHDSHLLPPV